jgi:hypothetical protein
LNIKYKMKNFYIFGLHRSGTNFLTNLISQNYKNTIYKSSNTNFSDDWKHSFKGFLINDDSLKIVIYKNVNTWVESVLIRRPYDGHHIIKALEVQDNDKYITLQSMESKYFFIDGKISLSHIVESYVYFYENYLNNDDNVIFVKYEDLLHKEGLERVMKKLGKKFEIERETFITPSKVTLSPNFNEENKKYYKEGKTIFLPEECLMIIKNIVGDRLNKLEEKKI